MPPVQTCLALLADFAAAPSWQAEGSAVSAAALSEMRPAAITSHNCVGALEILVVGSPKLAGRHPAGLRNVQTELAMHGWAGGLLVTSSHSHTSVHTQRCARRQGS